MIIRRSIAVCTAALAIGICVFITAISSDVASSSLIINFAFLGVMLLAILGSIATCLSRIWGITKGLHRATEIIRTSKTAISPDGNLFENRFLDAAYARYCDMVKQHPDGSCDIIDFINEDVIETHIHRPLLELVPDVLTSLGILGTFLGLVLGLRSFDPSGYEQMADSVSPLIDGIKVAFVTSIYGLSLSLPFSFNLRSEIAELTSHLEAFTDVFYLYIRPSHEVAAAAQLAEQHKSQEELTQDLTELFVEQMTRCFEQSITPAFAQMTNAIHRIVDEFTQNQEEAVARICQAVMKDMHDGLDAEFSRVGQAVNQLQKTQNEYSGFMDRSMSRLQQGFSSLQSTMEKSERYHEDTLGKLNKAQKEAFRINEDQNATYQEYIRFMYQTIERFSEIWELQSEKLQRYSDEIARMGPVQSNLEIRKDLRALSGQLEDLKNRMSLAQEWTDAGQSEQLSEILKRLNRLEKLSEEPILFRRKNKR